MRVDALSWGTVMTNAVRSGGEEPPTPALRRRLARPWMTRAVAEKDRMRVNVVMDLMVMRRESRRETSGEGISCLVWDYGEKACYDGWGGWVVIGW